jgi:GPI mannosyltransferase 3
LFFAGLCCGLAVSLRIQLVPAVGLAALYFCRADWRKRIPVVAAGLLLPVLIFGLVDAFTWSHPFQSIYKYFYVNLVQGRSASFGVEAWYWYLPKLVRHLGPLLLFVIIGVRRSPFLGWLALTILVFHSLIGHKEARFLYPMMPLVITLAALGIVECANLLSTIWRIPATTRLVAALGMTLCVATSVLLGVMFKDWSRFSGSLIAFKRLSREETLCGVGISQYSWLETGGYSYLHRNVPILALPSKESLRRSSASINALLHNGRLESLPAGFALQGCWNGICLYERPGICAAIPEEYEINRTLARADQ